MPAGGNFRMAAVRTALGLILLLCTQAALACPTCYSSALGSKGMQALKSGILILLLPTIAIFGALLLLTFRYRNSCPSWRRAVEKDLRTDPADGSPHAGILPVP